MKTAYISRNQKINNFFKIYFDQTVGLTMAQSHDLRAILFKCDRWPLTAEVLRRKENL